MVNKPFNLSLRGEYLTLAVCVGLSLTMLFLPGDTRIRVADRLGLVMTAPYWGVRNFGKTCSTPRRTTPGFASGWPNSN